MSSLKMLGRMLAVDLRFGAMEVAPRFGMACLLLGFLAALFRFLTLQDDGNFATASFIDCLASLFGGMREFDPLHDSSFNVPAAWLCVCLMGGLVVLSYPTQNLESIGINQCIEARGRWCWWISKCLWTTVCTFLYWLLAIAIALVASGGFFDNGDLALSPRTVELLGFFAASTCAAFEGSPGLLVFVVGIPFALSALYLIQLAISVNSNPLAAFAVTASLLFYAAFYLDGLLLGNYLMLARSNLVIHNGVDAASGIALAIAVSTAAVLVGGRVFARRDLIGKERYSR